MLAGRELALNTHLLKKGELKKVFPLIGKDFLKLILGITISVAIVIAIQNFS